jgi:hypothetical protein
MKINNQEYTPYGDSIVLKMQVKIPKFEQISQDDFKNEAGLIVTAEHANKEISAARAEADKKPLVVMEISKDFNYKTLSIGDKVYVNGSLREIEIGGEVFFQAESYAILGVIKD